MSAAAFTNHEVVNKSPSDYVEIIVSLAVLVKAWSHSAFAYEMLESGGSIKPDTKMGHDILERYLRAQNALKNGDAVTKPVIGIGIMDNVEIGIGREIAVAAYAIGLDNMPVHVRVQQSKEIEKLLKA